MKARPRGPLKKNRQCCFSLAGIILADISITLLSTSVSQTIATTLGSTQPQPQLPARTIISLRSVTSYATLVPLRFAPCANAWSVRALALGHSDYLQGPCHHPRLFCRFKRFRAVSSPPPSSSTTDSRRAFDIVILGFIHSLIQHHHAPKGDRRHLAAVSHARRTVRLAPIACTHSTSAGTAR